MLKQNHAVNCKIDLRHITCANLEGLQCLLLYEVLELSQLEKSEKKLL